MMIPLWVMVLVVGVLLVIAAGMDAVSEFRKKHEGRIRKEFEHGQEATG